MIAGRDHDRVRAEIPDQGARQRRNRAPHRHQDERRGNEQIGARDRDAATLAASQRMTADRPHAAARGASECVADPGSRAAGVDDHRVLRHRAGDLLDQPRQAVDRSREHREIGRAARGNQRARRLVDRAERERGTCGVRIAVVPDPPPAAGAAEREPDRAADLAEPDQRDRAARYRDHLRLLRDHRGRRLRRHPAARRGALAVRQVGTQQLGAVEVDRHQTDPARDIAHREQHAHHPRQRPRDADLDRTQQRHVGPAEPARGVGREVGVEVGRRGEHRAHDLVAREVVDREQRAEQAGGRVADLFGAVRAHLDGAAHGGDGERTRGRH